MKRFVAVAAVAALAASPSTAIAQEIVGATSANVVSGGTYPGTSITDTINQHGLLTNYTSGVTDFDSYIAGNPQHDYAFFGNEWFGENATGSVVYDLGSIMSIDALALWNEDADGIGSLSLWGSTDGVGFFSLGMFNPADNPIDANYGPEVFNFLASDLRYIRFDMSQCGDNLCAIGEVAFRVAGGVPEPGTWAMMLAGLGAIGFQLRRGKRQAKLALA